MFLAPLAERCYTLCYRPIHRHPMHVR